MHTNIRDHQLRGQRKQYGTQCLIVSIYVGIAYTMTNATSDGFANVITPSK